MEKLPYVFFGSPPIGHIALETLIKEKYPPVLSITDKSLPLEELMIQVEAAKPTFFLVVGYGAILKQPLLDLVAGQVLNIHPSLLPDYRGPAPVVQAILDGVRETGVSLMEIDAKMDHGPVLAQERYPLRGNEYPSELYEVLTKRGVYLFLEHIEAYLNEEIDLLPQNHEEATITHFVKKEDGLLDFSKPVDELERMVRAYEEWPCAYLIRDGKRLIVHKAHVFEGNLLFDEVQPEGGKRMTMSAYLNGIRMKEADFYASLFYTLDVQV